MSIALLPHVTPEWLEPVVNRVSEMAAQLGVTSLDQDDIRTFTLMFIAANLTLEEAELNYERNQTKQ